MAGLTLDGCTQSQAYREIFGQGRLEGRQAGRLEGRLEGELQMALRLLTRRCGTLSAEQEARIRSLPLERLEALADALFDFRGADDLAAWLEVG